MNKKGRKLIEILNCMELFGKKISKKHNKLRQLILTLRISSMNNELNLSGLGM